MRSPVAIAKSIHPNLTSNGFRPLSFAPADMQSFSAPRVGKMIDTCFAYLADFPPAFRSKVKVGELRHAAARWGRENGGAKYILEGPMIVALVCLGRSITVDGDGFAFAN